MSSYNKIYGYIKNHNSICKKCPICNSTNVRYVGLKYGELGPKTFKCNDPRCKTHWLIAGTYVHIIESVNVG